MVSIWNGRYGVKQKPNPNYCAESVPEGGRSVSFHQCYRKPSVHREVEGKTYGFCKQHDPVAVAVRNKAQRERWEREYQEKQASWTRQDQTCKALDACKETIEKIAAGHNNPRALAAEALALFPKVETGA